MISETLIKGQIIELKVQEELLRYGFDISIPSYNASRYDLIADTGKELLRIQVKKSIQMTESSIMFSCTSANNIKSANSKKHKYTSDEIDYFATVWKDQVYLIPIDETSNNKTIKIEDEQYFAQNILSSYYRMSDEDLFNKSSTMVNKNINITEKRNNHKYCIDCGREISQNAIRCVSCWNKYQQHAERPDRETLKKLIKEKPFTQIGKEYGVTDNAIRKWCDNYNLPRKKSDIIKYSEKEWKII